MKALGVLGVYISDLTMSADVVLKLLVTIQGIVIPLSTLSTEGNILKIDVATAWKDMGLNSRYSNEIPLRIYVT